MTHRVMSLPAFLTFAATGVLAAAAIPAAAQSNGDFHWSGTPSNGHTVSIGNVSGDVRVSTSTSGKVEVTGIKRGRDADRVRADVEQTSRGLVICVLYDDDASCDDRGSHSNRGSRRGNRESNDASMNLEVRVPSSLAVSASSVSGNVDVTGAQGDVDANSVSGDVRLDHLRATTIRANSVSGNVDVQVDELTGRGDLTFNTVSGDVTLDLPRQFDADVSMSTVSGEMNSDYPLTLNNGRMNRRSINARIGNGGRRLDLSTVSGDVKLHMASR